MRRHRRPGRQTEARAVVGKGRDGPRSRRPHKSARRASATDAPRALTSAGCSPADLPQAEITFGSFLGTAPRLIPHEMVALQEQHREGLPDLEERQQAGEDLAQAVLHHATWLHAELIRIHPYWDGNGRLARLVQAWRCWRFDQPVPIYTNRARYLAALNRYHHTRDLTLLLQLSQESQRRPG